MTHDEIDELEEDLKCTEDWAPKANYLVTKLLQEYQEQRAEIERLVARTWNENVQFIQESKDHLLQQYVNLTQMYGTQKHEIRELTAEIERLQAEIDAKDELIQLNGQALGEMDQELDRVVGEAIKFAERMDEEWTEDKESHHKAFLENPEVQAWKERQKAGS